MLSGMLSGIPASVSLADAGTSPHNLQGFSRGLSLQLRTAASLPRARMISLLNGSGV